MSQSIIERINHGYRELEPIILGLMALNKSFMLIGRHGTGKTRLARTLSQGYGHDGFVFYDATKDDLISVAGVPNAENIKQGTLSFVPHQRSIWSKHTIVVDEITRAGKESQNLWLEILEERTCFGLPLPYRSLIATANPESYAAAFQMDDALLDRFYAVIPVPELQENVSPSDIEAMVTLAARPEPSPEPEELAREFLEIQKAQAGLIRDGARESISKYLGQLIPPLLQTLQEQNGPFLSPRTYSRNLPETLLAVASYFQANGAQEPLQRAAVMSLRYAVATKLQIKPATIQAIHEAAAPCLSSSSMKSGDSLRLELNAIDSYEERLQFLKDHWDELKTELKQDEAEKIVGELLRGASQKGEKEKLVELENTLKSLGYQGDALRQIDGRLLIVLNSGINHLLPILGRIKGKRSVKTHYPGALKNIEAFEAMVSEGTFLSSRTPSALALKTYIIDLYEGDQPEDDQSILEFFASLEDLQ